MADAKAEGDIGRPTWPDAESDVQSVLARVVREAVADAVAPLERRIAELEGRGAATHEPATVGRAGAAALLRLSLR